MITTKIQERIDAARAIVIMLDEILKIEQDNNDEEQKPEEGQIQDTGDNNNQDPDKDPDDDERKKEEIKKIAERIAKGHAYDKHKDEFPDIESPEDLEEKIEDILNNADEVKELPRGRTVYWDEETGTAVVDDPANEGTIFKPKSGKEWFDEL